MDTSLQNQYQVKYPEYISSNPKSVTSGITLDVALRNGDDDDIPSKLYLPPQIVEEDIMTTDDEEIDETDLAERIRQRLTLQRAEDPEDVARYRMLQQRYQTLTQQNVAYEEDLRQGEIDLNGHLITAVNNPSGNIHEEYPTSLGRFQNDHQMTDTDIVDEEEHMIRGVQEGKDLLRSLQHSSYDNASNDEEVHSNSYHETDSPATYHDKKSMQYKSRGAAVAPEPLHDGPGEYPLNLGVAQMYDGGKMEKGYENASKNHLSRSERWKSTIIPGCCFVIGIAATVGVLFALDFSELSVFGYKISFDAITSRGEDSESNATLVVPTTSPVPSSSPTFQPTSMLDRGESAPGPSSSTNVPSTTYQSTSSPSDLNQSEGSNTAHPTSTMSNTPSSAPSLRGTVSTETPSHFPTTSEELSTSTTINQPNVSPVVPTNAPELSITQVPTMQPTTSPISPPSQTVTTAGPTNIASTQSPTKVPSQAPTTVKPTSTPQWLLEGGPFAANEAGKGQGKSIAIAGPYMVSGEPKVNNTIGQINIYKELDSWSALYSIQENDASLFGSALDMEIIDGKAHLLVGAEDTEDDGGFASFGSFSYYQLDENGWSQVGSTIKPAFNLVESGGKFGAAVAMAQDTQRVVVGAPDSSLDGNNLDTGRVYTYEYDGTDWVSIAGPVVGSAESMLGTSLDLSKNGNKMLVGAPQAGNGNGAAYYYEWDEDKGSWVSILPVPGGDGESLGTSVAFLNDDATLLAFGGPSYGNNQGVIKIYADFGGVFFPMGDSIVGNDGEKIGTTLTGSGGTLAFGTDSGSFRVFALNGSSWSEVATGPNLGSAVVSIDISEDTQEVAVGLANEEIFVYKLY